MANSNNPTGPGQANVDAAKQLKDMMASMASVSAALERSFQNQAKAMQDMANAMSNMQSSNIASQMSQMNDAIKQALEAINKLATSSTASLNATGAAAAGAAASTSRAATQIAAAGSAAASASTSTQNFGNILGDVSETSEGFGSKIEKIGKYLKKEYPIAVGAALGALSGLAQGFRNIMAVGKGVFGIFETLVNTMFELGTAILAIPFSIYNGLLDMARKHASASMEYAQAIEKVRENFGALTNSTPKAIFGTARALGSLKLSGVSAMAVFGNMAERIEKLNALFMAGGPAIRNLSAEFVKSGGALLGYQKGLGLSDEMMGSIAQRAQSMGKPMGKILNDITKQALHLGKAFQLDSKIISREMGKAAMDMRHFGDVSIKQIGVAVTYAHKLGIDLEKVTGIMDQFSTFDAAAENVSKLNEAFGTNINAMELLQAESPTEQLEILRKEMARVGVDGEKLNRHYRALITQTTSLDDATIKSAFSSKNQGVSLKNIQKESEKAEKKTMSQAEAMSKLSDSMERMIKTMDLGSGGFFAAFLNGIMQGITTSPAFVKILSNIAAALSMVIQEGRKLGQFLMKNFPGLADLADGVANLFSPKKFQKLFADIRKAVEDFVLGLTDKGKKFSFPDMMEKIKKAFFDFFSSEEPAGAQALKGFRTMFAAISKILAEGIKWALLEMAGFIRNLIEFIKNPKVIQGVGAVGEAVDSFFAPIIAAIIEAGPVLWSALVELFTFAFNALFSWVKSSLAPLIEPYLPYIWGGLALIFFGPVFLQSMLGAFIGAMTTVFVKGVGVAATRAAASGMLGKAAQSLANAARGAAGAGSVGPATGAVRAAINAAPNPAATANAQATASVINGGLIVKLLLALAAIIAIGLVAFYAAAKIAEGMSTETIVKALAIIGVMAVNLMIVSANLFLLSKMPPVSASIVPALAAVGVVMLAIIGLGYLAVDSLGGFTLGQVASAMLVVTGMTIALIGVTAAVAALMGVGAIISGSGGLALGAAAVGLVAVGVLLIAVVGLGKHIVESVKSSNFSTTDITKAMLLLVVSMEALGIVLVGIGGLAAIAAASPFAAIAASLLLIFGGDVLISMLDSVLNLGLHLVEKSSGLSTESLKKASILVVVSLEAMGLILTGMIAATAGIVFAAVGGALGGMLLVFGKGVLISVLDSVVDLGLHLVEKAANISGDSLKKATLLVIVSIEALGMILTGMVAATSGIAFAAMGGIFGGLALVFGKGVLKKVLDSVIDLGDHLVQKAAALPNGIEGKLEAFSKALGAIVSLVAAIPAILEASSKKSGGVTLVGGFSKSEPQIEALSTFVDKMFGSADSGLIGLISKVISGVSSIGASESALKAAAALASVIAAVGEIVQGLAPPPGFNEALKEAASGWSGGAAPLMEAFTKNATDILNVLAPKEGKGFISSIVSSLSDPALSSFDETKIKGVEAVSAFMKVIPALSSALFPPDSVVNAVKEAATSFFGGGEKAEALLRSFRKNAEKMSELLGGDDGLIKTATTSVKSVIDSLAGKTISGEQLEMLKAVSPLLSVMFESIGSMTKSMPDAAKLKGEDLKQFAEVLTGMKTSIEGMFKAAETVIPNMIDGVKKAVEVLGGIDAEKLKTGLDTIKEVFGILKTIPELGNTIKGFTGGKSFMSEGVQLQKDIGGVVILLRNLTNPGVVQAGAPSALQLIKETLTSPIFQELAGQQANIETLKSTFGVIKSLMDILAAITAQGLAGGEGSLGRFNGMTWQLKYSADLMYNYAGVSLPVMKDAILESNKHAPTIMKGAPAFKETLGLIGEVTKLLPSTYAEAEKLAKAPPIGDLTGIKTSYVQLVSFLNGLMGSEESISFGKNVAANVKKTESVLKSTITPGITAISDIIKATQKLQGLIADGAKLDIPASLKAFAAGGAATLGASGKYTISTSPVVVEVNLAVAIDAKELEKVMVQNKNSIIRDRVHYLLGLTVGKDSKSVYDAVKDGKQSNYLSQKDTDGRLPDNINTPTKLVGGP